MSDAARRHVAAPRVTVVIPTYNRARDLQRGLRSLAAQTVRDFEVIVCDDGSTDDTAAVVDAFTTELDITRSVAERWGGPARPRNRGIALARAPYVAFLDADDWWTRDKLAVSLPHLNQGADLVYHDLYVVSGGRQRILFQKEHARTLTRPAFRDLLHNGNGIPLSSVVMRRSLLLAIGGMPDDRSLIAMEDYICWLNAAQLTENFVRVRGTFGYYWYGGGNITNDARTLQLLAVLEKRYGDTLRDANNTVPGWISYERGRASYRLAALDVARAQLALVTPRNAPFSLALRALFVRATIALATTYRALLRRRTR